MSTNLPTITELFHQYSDKHYGENCSQLVHAISCGSLADQQSLPESMAIAAFLHDIGHFLADHQGLPDFDQWGYAKHDQLGADYLTKLGWPRDITEPIRLHVAAKRYQQTKRVQQVELSGQDSEAKALSSASAATLAQQGGLMTSSELLAFEQETYFAQALQLRQLDDTGKPNQAITIDLNHWLNRVNSFLTV